MLPAAGEVDVLSAQLVVQEGRDELGLSDFANPVVLHVRRHDLI